MVDREDNCFSPAFQASTEIFRKYEMLGRFVVDEINARYLPTGFNLCRLLDIHAVSRYPDVAFQVRMSLSLVQTNCSGFPLDSTCAPQSDRSSLAAEVIIIEEPCYGTQQLVSVKLNQHNCSLAISTDQTPLRDCSRGIPPLRVRPLKNVSICFQGVGLGLKAELGSGDC